MTESHSQLVEVLSPYAFLLLFQNEIENNLKHFLKQDCKRTAISALTIIYPSPVLCSCSDKGLNGSLAASPETSMNQEFALHTSIQGDRGDMLNAIKHSS